MKLDIKTYIDSDDHIMDIWAWNTSVSVYTCEAGNYNMMGMLDSGSSLTSTHYNTLTELFDAVASKNTGCPYCAEEERIGICIDKHYKYANDIISAANAWVEQWNLIHERDEDEKD